MSIAKIAFSPLEDALLKKLGEGTGLIGLSIGETETGNLRIDLYFERGKSTTLFDIPIALEVHNHEINPFYHPLGGPTKGLHSGLQPGSSVRAVAVYLGLEIESEQGSIGAFVVTDRGNWLITANHVISENGHYDLLTADDDDGIHHWIPGIKETLSQNIFSKLNPLKVCSPAIVTEFAKIANHLGVVYVYHLLETNKRLRLSHFVAVGERETALSVRKEESYQQLDEYFPFDPYHLPRSKRWVEGDYRVWKGIPDLQEDGAEESESDEEDEEEESEMEEGTGTDDEDD